MPKKLRAFFAAPRSYAPKPRLALLAAIACSAAACTSSGVLDVRPSVDVAQTSAIRMNATPAFEEDPNGGFSESSPDVQPEPSYDASIALPGNDASEYDGASAANAEEPVYDQDADVDAASMTPQPIEPEPAMTIRRLPPVATTPRQQQPYEVAAYPRMQSPVASTRNAISGEEADCRKQLKKLGVTFQNVPSIRDSASCYIDNPVKVSSIGSVQMKPAATLTCSMALTFAQWTKKELVPGARWKYFSGVKTIRQGSSYSCRRIAGSGKPSAHSQGNALDVMAIELNNGKTIDVKKQGIFAFRARKLLNNVRADGCEYFTTVLGPGYNYDHRDHFHFDLMERKNGRRACH